MEESSRGTDSNYGNGQSFIREDLKSPENIYDLAISSFDRWSIAISFTIFLTFTDYF